MRRIPSTLVLAAILVVAASWPSVESWSELNFLHHFLVHGLYLVSGGLFGMQTALWMDAPATVSLDEPGVSS